MRKCTFAAELRIYDKNNIWAQPYVVSLENNRSVVVDLQSMVTASGKKIDPSNICMIGFSSDGSSAFYVKEMFLSDDGVNPTAIFDLNLSSNEEMNASSGDIYDLTGRKVVNPRKGIFIHNNQKIILK